MSQPNTTPGGGGYGTQPDRMTSLNSSQGQAPNEGPRGENSGGANETIFRMPPPRAPPNRAPLPRAAQSPPCYRNTFLDDAEQPAECSAHGRSASSTSAAALAMMSRLRTDFVDLGNIGRGGFCKVFKVIGRLDGAMYAVKRTERKLQGEREKCEALKEVQAMAGLGSGCEHIVRYFGAWMEYDHLYIQLELCESSLSSLQEKSITAMAEEAGKSGGDWGGDAAPFFGEKEVAKVLRHVGAALECAHARNIAHLDVKPDNILVLRGVYKLADWGRAVPTDGIGNVSFAPTDGRGMRRTVSVEEGDARYLAPELLRGEFHAGGGVSSARGSSCESPSTGLDAGMNSLPLDEDLEGGPGGTPGSDFVGLDRADIWSLGATAYELARGAPLPASGEEYQALRRGEMAPIVGFSLPFQTLLASLMKEDPAARPTARALLKSGALAPPSPVHPGTGQGMGACATGGGVNARHHPPLGHPPSCLGQESRASLGGCAGAGLMQ